jgi:hypothetical protein
MATHQGRADAAGRSMQHHGLKLRDRAHLATILTAAAGISCQARDKFLKWTLRTCCDRIAIARSRHLMCQPRSTGLGNGPMGEREWVDGDGRCRSAMPTVRLFADWSEYQMIIRQRCTWRTGQALCGRHHTENCGGSSSAARAASRGGGRADSIPPDIVGG